MSDRYASLKQGLVGCWIPSISGSGLLLPDLSGRGNNGALTGMDASDWVSASYGRALDIFDDQYIDGGTMQGLSLAYPFSMSCWVQNITSNNVDFSPFAKTRQVGTYQGPMIYFASATNATVVAYWAGGTRATGATVVTQLSNWTHVGICWTGSQARVYVNGRLDGTGNTVTAPDASTASVNIGRYNSEGFGQRSMRGRIDDCRIYDRCLTDSEWSLLASEPGIGFKPAKKLSRFSQRFTYNPPKARNYSVTRVKETDYATLRQGLVGAWCPSLPNGGSGNTLPDVSGRGNHGTLTNMGPEDWVSSQYGRALEFDGVDDNVIANTAIVLKKTEGFTITGWVYRNATNVKGTFFKSGSIASNSGYGLAVGNANNADQDGDTLNFLFEGSAWVSTGATMSAQRWDHVAFAMSPISGGTAIAYLNGVEVKRETRGVDPTTTTIYIGGYNIVAFSLNRHFAGAVDDIRAYSRVLTESEIRLLASRPGIGLRQESHRQTFYQFPSFQPAIAKRSSAIIGGGIT